MFKRVPLVFTRRDSNILSIFQVLQGLTGPR